MTIVSESLGGFVGLEDGQPARHRAWDVGRLHNAGGTRVDPPPRAVVGGEEREDFGLQMAFRDETGHAGWVVELVNLASAANRFDRIALLGNRHFAERAHVVGFDLNGTRRLGPTSSQEQSQGEHRAFREHTRDKPLPGLDCA